MTDKPLCFVYIFWTSPSKEEAKRIILELLERRLVACASILGQVESLYRWEGKIEQSDEVKVIFKTKSTHFKAIYTYIVQHGSYSVPEVLQIDIAQGNPDYLSWLSKETT